MRIAALGRTRMLFDAIRLLSDRGHTVSLVATCRASPESEIGERDFAALAAELGAEYFHATSLNTPEMVARLAAARADLAVSVNWLTLIGPAACAAFPRGILNAHAGALPRYRGNAPVAWAILNGESEIGVTIHEMDPSALDTGPIVLVQSLPLASTTRIGDVYSKLDRLVPEMFVEAIAGLESGRIVPIPQTGAPLRCYPRRPEDGAIDWRLDAVSLDRLVRATSEPFGGAYALHRGHRLTLWRARAVPWTEDYRAIPGQVLDREEGGVIHVATGDGVLRVIEVEAGGGRVAPGSLIRSTRERLECAPSGSLLPGA